MIIKNGIVVTPDSLERCDIKVQGDTIVGLGQFDDEKDFVIDAEGLYVCPGLVDIHTHGGGGGDFMDATEESFQKALAFENCPTGYMRRLV